MVSNMPPPLHALQPSGFFGARLSSLFPTLPLARRGQASIKRGAEVSGAWFMHFHATCSACIRTEYCVPYYVEGESVR
ncbi:hypothetical protein CPAR01_02015 [Colletotrichum paranaense]|uniref:Uncharacterized protein n=1 Tax=Colletotrichum paranaense TaxID=1914294 RepID=A0ABQ9SYB7_9PEZI|nr:uncharacterized protein CPAR01_02015 [Colletotrichum paranaense]KAK1544513.1 hypothetical protein CPAR01_02015 [Colletotrichum paranaense]